MEKNRGVSPVVSILLLLALTVALVSLTTTILFDISDTSESPQTEIEITHNEFSGNFDVQMKIIRNENVRKYSAVNRDSECVTFDINKSGQSQLISNADCEEPGFSEMTEVESGDEITFRAHVGSQIYVIETYIIPS